MQVIVTVWNQSLTVIEYNMWVKDVRECIYDKEISTVITSVGLSAVCVLLH